MDLSQLSTEQLEAYKAILARKQSGDIPPNPSDTIPKANPTPKELQGEAPGKIRQLIQNIPGSAINAVRQGAQMAGAAPGNADVYDPNYKDPLIEGAKNLYKKVTANFPKVGETEANGDTVAGEGFPRITALGNALKDQAVEDPVGTALNAADINNTTEFQFNGSYFAT